MKTRVLFWAFLFGFLVVNVWLLYRVNGYHGEIERTLKLNSLQDKADIALRTLEKLKNNDTNTVPFLEKQLDLTVMSLGDILKSVPSSRWDVSSLRILSEARDYRGRFPTSQIDPGVLQAFSILDRATNKPSR